MRPCQLFEMVLMTKKGDAAPLAPKTVWAMLHLSHGPGLILGRPRERNLITIFTCYVSDVDCRGA